MRIFQSLKGSWPYDGGAEGVSSSADIAKRLKAPVILVLDCKSVGYKIAATALGFREYDRDTHIAGVILNRLGSDRHEAMVRDVMEKSTCPSSVLTTGTTDLKRRSGIWD